MGKHFDGLAAQCGFNSVVWPLACLPMQRKSTVFILSPPPSQNKEKCSCLCLRSVIKWNLWCYVTDCVASLKATENSEWKLHQSWWKYPEEVAELVQMWLDPTQEWRGWDFMTDEKNVSKQQEHHRIQPQSLPQNFKLRPCAIQAAACPVALHAPVSIKYHKKHQDSTSGKQS